MTDTHTELKPCPFCGGPAGLGSDDAYDDVTWQAYCKHCHATIERDLKDHAAELWNTRAAIEALPARNDERAEFQARVDKWMDACFNAAIKADVQERCDRFIEEALEFVQAAGYSAERAHALVDYTFGRPQGEINQEVGGVMVTLAAMCNTLGIDIDVCAETELARVWTKIDTIRAKQAAKPTGSALPIAQARNDERALKLVEALKPFAVWIEAARGATPWRAGPILSSFPGGPKLTVADFDRALAALADTQPSGETR
jgi:Lar family restriction alleviation protein